MDGRAESARLRSERGIGEYEPLAPFVSERTVDRSLWYEGQLMTVYAQGDVVDNTCCVWEGNIPPSTTPSGIPWCSCRAGRIHWFVATSPATRMLSFTVTASREYPGINDNVALFRLIGVPAESMTMPPEAEVEQLPDRAEIARVNYEMGGDLPDLERLGRRRGYGEEGANADG